MKRVALIHFKPEEAPERVERLRSAGLIADYFDLKADHLMRGLRADPPDAVLIDLARLPSHGKEVGMALRRYAAMKSVPVVFIEGDPSKTGNVRAAVPDAVFTTWDTVVNDVVNLRTPTRAARVPDVPPSTKPLVQKLGIGADAKILTIGAPETFEDTLGGLPEGAEFIRSGAADVLIVFATTQAELEIRFTKALLRVNDKTRLWIAWPKKASGFPSDLSENAVREFALALGWVDYKVCAIDSTWSGFLFSRKKEAGTRTLRQAAT